MTARRRTREHAPEDIENLVTALERARQSVEERLSTESTAPVQAAVLYRERRRRDRIFEADLFGEPAWDMLLDLYNAEGKGNLISVSSACVASMVPATTALRYILRLEEAGFVKRLPDPMDRRRSNLCLTKEARNRMNIFLDQP